MKGISTFVIALLVFSFMFLALPDKGYSGADMMHIGCCQGTGECDDIFEGGTSCTVEAFREGQICNEATGQCVQQVNNTPIPTLSEWGLIAMAGILGIVGFMVIRRRKATA